MTILPDTVYEDREEAHTRLATINRQQLDIYTASVIQAGHQGEWKHLPRQGVLPRQTAQQTYVAEICTTQAAEEEQEE